MYSGTFVGRVIVVKQTLNVAKYLNIIAGKLQRYMASVFPTGGEMFQQKNVPCPKARIKLE